MPRENTMVETAKAGTKWLGKGEPSKHDMKLRGKKRSGEMAKILTDVKGIKNKKRRLNQMERTAIEGAKFAMREKKSI